MPERRIRIIAGEVAATANLKDSRTADAIWAALPIEGRANRWGDEIRAASPVNVFGRIEGDATEFGSVRSGERVRIEAV